MGIPSEVEAVEATSILRSSEPAISVSVAYSAANVMANSQDFLKAAEDVKKLTKTPDNSELASLYGLYKQAIVGDINIERPGMLNMNGRAKWDAWNEKKGLSKEDAERDYICVVDGLIDKYGLQ